MRALALNYNDGKLAERNLSEPLISRTGEVLFRIREVGVCGTDRELANLHFGYPPDGDEYLIIGHEAVGEVVQVASDVAGIRVGDVVVPMIRRPCIPPCASCAAGQRDLCLTGRFTERGIFGAHGYFAELAVDSASDLMVIPADCAAIAVLIEPLSVVEKAVSAAMRLHIGDPRTALVAGAGTIGLLAAMVLKHRGFEVTLLSLEEEESARARLVESLGVMYTRQTGRKFDIVIEAAGSQAAAENGAKALGPVGVMMVLGAKSAALSLIDVIVNNQTIAGSVNAGPRAFEQAVADLPHLPRHTLESMIRRDPFSGWRSTLTGPALEHPKIVHVIGN